MVDLDPSWLPDSLARDPSVYRDPTPRADPGEGKGKKKKKGGVKIKKVKVKAAAEEEPEDVAEAEPDTTSFPRLSTCCSLCGKEPELGPSAMYTFPCCSKCGETRYCGRNCQIEAWKQPCAHKASCGCKLPTPRVIASSTVVEVATIMHEFGRSDVDLALACTSRLVALLPASSSSRRDGHDSGAPAAMVVSMAPTSSARI